MKKNVLITLVLFFSLNIYGQVINYYYFTTEQLQSNLNINKIQDCSVISLDIDKLSFCLGIKKYNFDVETTNVLIYSKIIIHGNKIILKEKTLKSKYIFEMNDFGIVSLKNNRFFNKGDKFFICEISNLNSKYRYDYRSYFDINDLLYTSYWKDGVKNGIFSIFSNSKIEYIYYKNNKKIDSIIVNQELNNDTVDLFINKYHKPVQMSK